MRYLHREGLLTPGRSEVLTWMRPGETQASIGWRAESDRVTLTYRHQHRGGEWRPMAYSVRLTWTPCHLGGKRPWFLCPAQGCGRRVAILYVGSSAIFACRRCYELAYESQRESIDDRAARRADKIRERLGWQPGFLNGPSGKPKGMHWRTFERLTARHDAFVQISLTGMAERFGQLDRLGLANRRLQDRLDR